MDEAAGAGELGAAGPRAAATRLCQLVADRPVLYGGKRRTLCRAVLRCAALCCDALCCAGQGRAGLNCSLSPCLCAQHVAAWPAFTYASGWPGHRCLPQHAPCMQPAPCAPRPPTPPPQASDASGTGLLDAAARAWDRQRIAQLDTERLPGSLPELIGPQEVRRAPAAAHQPLLGQAAMQCGSAASRCPLSFPVFCRHRLLLPQVVGTLRPEVAAQLGLPGDVQVAPGGGDNAMSALGAGAVREGSWVLSLGTSGG